MKVTRRTPDQLIVENNPVWMAIGISACSLLFVAIGVSMITTELLIGLVFAGTGLLMGTVFILAFIRRTQLILDRPRNLVELRRKSMLRYLRMTWGLDELDRAILQTSNSGDSTTYRVALRIDKGMDAGTHPVTLVYTSGTGGERAVDAINAWLSDAR